MNRGQGAASRRKSPTTASAIGATKRRSIPTPCMPASAVWSGSSSRRMASWEGNMPLYMAQFAYTVDAWAAFTKNPENRTAGIQHRAKKGGGEVGAAGCSFGVYE